MFFLTKDKKTTKQCVQISEVGSMKTYQAKKEDINRNWVVVDAQDQVMGRLASDIAHRLRGKHRPEYTPHVDTGDFVVVVNAARVSLTGRKWTDKLYHHYSGYPGGLKTITAGKVLKEKPERLLYMAVRGMLPKNTLGRAMLKKLKIYAGNDHPHQAQCPHVWKRVAVNQEAQAGQ
jgi:large subunit ribosomal protein L13